MAKRELTAIIKEAEEGGYFAYCPALKGCISQGETMEEVVRNIKEAICMYVDALRERQFQEFFNHLIKQNYEKTQVLGKKEDVVKTIPVSCSDAMLANA